MASSGDEVTSYSGEELEHLPPKKRRVDSKERRCLVSEQENKTQRENECIVGTPPSGWDIDSQKVFFVLDRGCLLPAFIAPPSCFSSLPILKENKKDVLVDYVVDDTCEWVSFDACHSLSSLSGIDFKLSRRIISSRKSATFALAYKRAMREIRHLKCCHNLRLCDVEDLILNCFECEICGEISHKKCGKCRCDSVNSKHLESVIYNFQYSNSLRQKKGDEFFYKSNSGEMQTEVFRLRDSHAAFNGVNSFGLRAKKEMGKGEIIGHYAGEILENDRESDSTYCFELSETLMIDARHFGNHTRFLNHSDIGENVFAEKDGCRGVVIRTTRPVISGEELLLNYGPQYWLDLKERMKVIQG